MNRQLYDKLIFDHSSKGHHGADLPRYSYPDAMGKLPSALMRGTAPELPEVDEPTVARHYTNSSTNNFGVDTGFYPLGSCTMKYNPKLNETALALSGISGLHPMQPASTVQGALAIYWRLQEALSEIGGMARFTLNPMAGAQGEFNGAARGPRLSCLARRRRAAPCHCARLGSRHQSRFGRRCRI